MVRKGGGGGRKKGGAKNESNEGPGINISYGGGEVCLALGFWTQIYQR